MLLGRRPDAERFLANPDKAVRAALIFGRDLGVVRERGAWQDSERKRMSYDTLASRQLQQELKLENPRRASHSSAISTKRTAWSGWPD